MILDSIADGVFTVNEDFIITSFNRAARKITGVSRNEAIGRPCCEVFRADICEAGCALKQSMTTGRPIVNHWRSLKKIPSHTSLAVTIDKDVKSHGFAFVGPTVIYAHMQAIGMVNDHLVSRFRHAECQELA